MRKLQWCAAALAAVLMHVPLCAAAAQIDLDSEDGTLRAPEARIGEGVVVAVIDSSFDVRHPAFTMPEEAEGRLTPADLEEAWYDLYAYADPDELYVSEKIPFAYDYAGDDTDLRSASDHGTHVAASVAGYDPAADIVGAAPGAQLLLMKVFPDGMDSADISEAVACAVEDAIVLGADVISLSLGSLGYTLAYHADDPMAHALEEAAEAGILVVCAAGNEATNTYLGAAGMLPPAYHTDYGTANFPGVLPFALSVGALSSRLEDKVCLVAADGREIPFYDGSGASFFDAFAGQTVAYVPVPGFGTEADYAGLSVEGAVALVSRGETTFEEKIAAAAAHGAIGVLIYNNVDGTITMNVGDSTETPAASISLEDGEALRAAEEKTVCVQALYGLPAADALYPAEFTSRGATAEMRLSPLISTVGESVRSAVNGGGYEAMDGTSMATPQISGAAAALLSTHPAFLEGLEGMERVDALRAYLMACAAPVIDEASGLPFSPRAQGAGALTALGAEAMWAADDGVYAALGEGIDGPVTFTAHLINLADDARTYRLSAVVTTDDAVLGDDDVIYATLTPRMLPADVAFSGGDTVTVEAGGRADVTVTITPDPDFLAGWGEVFPCGFFLDGYLFAESGDGRVGLPLLGYCGDWDDGPIFDDGVWEGGGVLGRMNLLRLVEDERSNAGETADGIFADLFAFSPDFDGSADGVYLELMMLRSAESMTCEIFDADGELVCYYEDNETHLKTYSDLVELYYDTIGVWDGSDGINNHYILPDGLYTVRLTAYRYSGDGQSMEFPMRIDTVHPTIETFFEDGVLYAEATDDFAMRALRLYYPGEDESYPVWGGDMAAGDEPTPSLTGAAEVPEGIPYVYVYAEDQAGNVSVIRCYTED